MVELKKAALLLFCTGGIYGAYLTQGLVSEHLQMKRYGAAQERFGNLEALNGAQSLVCFLWAYALVALQRRAGGAKAAQEAAALPSWWEYWRPALTNSIGPAFGMIALKNISYPVSGALGPFRHAPPRLRADFERAFRRTQCPMPGGGKSEGGGRRARPRQAAWACVLALLPARGGAAQLRLAAAVVLCTVVSPTGPCTH